MNFNKKTILSSGLISLIILCFSLFSCEQSEIDELNIESDYQEFLSIDGDLENPQTLTTGKNMRIFTKASRRIRDNLDIKNNKLAWQIKSGKEINISEEIFEYITENYSRVNEKVEVGILYLAKDEKGEIRVRKAIDSSIKRLKSGNNEDDADECVDISEMNDQEILETLCNFYNGTSYGNLGDHFDLDAIDWKTGGDGSAKITGYGTINGHKASYGMENTCFYQETDNCCFNDIAEYDSYTSEEYGYSQFFIKNSAGGRLVTITIWE